MRAVLASVALAGLVACSAKPNPPPDPTPGGGGAPTLPTPTPGTGEVPVPQRQPPTLDSCRDQPPPEGETCQWALLSYGYCGGAPPPPEVYWPRCSCEACGIDADCPGGNHCVTLPTDAECHPPRNLCVAGANACPAGCKPDEQCMWVEGRAACKVPTMYPPRP